jgi:hypothetical protein
MNETADSRANNLPFEPPPALPGLYGVSLEGAEPSQQAQDATEELRPAYVEWLEKRDIDPTTVPRIEMGEREFLLFMGLPSSDYTRARKIYGISSADQVNCQYVQINIKPSDPSLPPNPELVTVTDADFGTAIDLNRTNALQSSVSAPDGPMPESGGALRTIDIGDTLVGSADGLQTVARGLMRRETVDPFAGNAENIGIRAGEPAPDQKDAYVWTASPFTKSVELTRAFPLTYDSICIVSGQRRDAANGKAGMEQIENPRVLLKIEGEDLENLQRVHEDLYKQPDFALTEAQRKERDQLFNGYLEGLLSEEARRNRIRQQDREDDERRLQQRPLLQERPIPRS